MVFELSFLKLLSAELYPRGYRYRKHYSKAIGKPDVVFVNQKIAVFLDSDFWHDHDFKNLRTRLRNDFGLKKITRNMQRDKDVTRALRKVGWHVLRFGENDLKKHLQHAVRLVADRLRV